MRQPTQRRLGLLALALLVSATLSAVSLPAAAEPDADGDPATGRVFGASYDDPGHVSRISTSGNKLYTGENDGMYAYRPFGRDIDISAYQGPERWFPFSVTLRAPEDGVLTVGSYEMTRFENELWGPSRRVDSIHGRCSPLGSFEIRELDPDLKHIWVFYRHPCDDGRLPPTIEIRLNMPAQEPLETMPTAVDYQLTPSGTFVKPTAVTVMNRLSRSVRVRDVDVVGAPSWVRRWNTCHDVIAPGGFCRVWVRFVATAPGSHSGTLTVDTDAGALEVPLSGFAGPADPDAPVRRASTEADAPPQPSPDSPGPPRTAWLMESEDGEFVGGGIAHSYARSDFASFGGSDGRFGLDVRTSRHYYGAHFYTPTTESILPGTAVPVRAGGSTGAAQLHVSGDHRGCNQHEGNFRVRQADFDLFGLVERLLVTFTHNCRDRRPRLHGTVAWNALGPIPKPPGYPRTPGLQARFSTSSSGLTRVEGRLTTPGSKRAREVVVERRIPEKQRWTIDLSMRTDKAGRFVGRFRVDEGSRVRVRFDGGPYLAPRSTPPRRVRK